MTTHIQAGGVFEPVNKETETKCERCRNTGYYGDNGPGIKGNDEYFECECQYGLAEKIMGTLGGPYGKGNIVLLINDYAQAVALAATRAKDEVIKEKDILIAQLSSEITSLKETYEAS